MRRRCPDQPCLYVTDTGILNRLRVELHASRSRPDPPRGGEARRERARFIVVAFGGPAIFAWKPGAGGKIERLISGVSSPADIRIDTKRQRVLIPVFTQNRRSEEHTSELQSRLHLVCRLLLEKKKKSHVPPYGPRV